MDSKIAALTQAFQRIARVHPHVMVVNSLRHPATRKFVALFKARNRRTRVLMRRAQRVRDAWKRIDDFNHMYGKPGQ